MFVWFAACSDPSGNTSPPLQSNSVPSWDSDPMVDAAAGGFVLNEGTVSGNPAPTVLYYYAAYPAKIPGELNFEGDTHWTEVPAGLPTITAIGDYSLYGLAVNSEGAVLSSEIYFSIPAPSTGDTQIISVDGLTFDLQYCPGAAAVKSKDPNALGCYDVSGNMWEWCFDEAYPWDGSKRTVQSGGWFNAASTLQVGEIQNTSTYSELARIGFRLCRNP